MLRSTAPIRGRLESLSLSEIVQIVTLGCKTGRLTLRQGRRKANWGFITQVGFGVRYELSKGQWLNVDYRQWHESNGTRVFNHSRAPNPGFESGSIWLGYAVDF